MNIFDYLINFGAIEDRVNGGRLGGGGISVRGKINNKSKESNSASTKVNEKLTKILSC